jgi:hypothetical protein
MSRSGDVNFAEAKDGEGGGEMTGNDEKTKRRDVRAAGGTRAVYCTAYGFECEHQRSTSLPPLSVDCAICASRMPT